MIDKRVATVAEALAGICDGATVVTIGFGGAGQSGEGVDRLIAHGASGLVIVNNDAGGGQTGLVSLHGAQGSQDHWLVSAASRLSVVRRPPRRRSTACRADRLKIPGSPP